MSLRMIELYLPREQAEKLRESFHESDFEIHGMWSEDLDGDAKLVRVLVSSGGTEAVVDTFQKRFKWLEDYRVVVLPAEATLPRPGEPETPEAKQTDVGRIMREELYADALETARLTGTFLVMVALSAIVATVGLARDNGVIVLSAMVIAPLLGPNVAFALATTLGDKALGRTSLKTAGAGFLLALLMAVATGALFRDQIANTAEITSRATLGIGDIVLALAAGAAGALSMTTGASSALIGVMVAVALLPPTTVTGILIGKGEFQMAAHAAGLTATNLICLVLAGIVTFLARGIRPATFWETEKAKRSTRRALVTGGILLAVLLLLLVVQECGSPTPK